MKIAPTATKLGVLLVLTAGMTLTGCTGISPEPPADDATTGDSESNHSDVPYGVEDFTYTTEDGTIVQCISSSGARGLSCDWEGATRPDDSENPEGKTSEGEKEN